jgi:hypothetical protein
MIPAESRLGKHLRERIQLRCLIQRRPGDTINIVANGFGPGDVRSKTISRSGP